MQKIEIIPAALCKTREDVERILSESTSDYIQIDACDGTLTPSETWPFVNGCIDDTLLRTGATKIELDVYTKNIQSILNIIPASRVILHYAFYSSQNDLITTAKALHERDITIGFGIMYTTSIEDVFELISMCHDVNITPYIQVMGIRHVGVQGQSFESNVLPLIKIIHAKYPDIMIQVDGAVTPETIRSLFDAGATGFVVGSWFSKSGFSITKGTDYLKSLL